jgi:hypothetical protein
VIRTSYDKGDDKFSDSFLRFAVGNSSDWSEGCVEDFCVETEFEGVAFFGFFLTTTPFRVFLLSRLLVVIDGFGWGMRSAAMGGGLEALARAATALE